MPQATQPVKPFSLVATFDSDPTQSYDVGAFFGTVSFSPIPLAAPLPYGDRPLQSSYNASHAGF